MCMRRILAPYFGATQPTQSSCQVGGRRALPVGELPTRYLDERMAYRVGLDPTPAFNQLWGTDDEVYLVGQLWLCKHMARRAAKNCGRREG